MRSRPLLAVLAGLAAVLLAGATAWALLGGSGGSGGAGRAPVPPPIDVPAREAPGDTPADGRSDPPAGTGAPGPAPESTPPPTPQQTDVVPPPPLPDDDSDADDDDDGGDDDGPRDTADADGVGDGAG
ncbi:hypothetical protein SAMN05660690_3418 [Geodermatophilus telluris]|uniref:Uncharacterized protein n=1 Tax=Geodermatophilus telluris TaxID=1190417 RepID=A0A1G6S247_9ACTN|nr:hypothetical protein [Geodermatophilus telluris]SDD10928.1 hypothetical protein SAMN05660690_3418 [Geodermatophilus telluris]